MGGKETFSIQASHQQRAAKFLLPRRFKMCQARDHPAAAITGANILVDSDPPMVQQDRGHTLALLSESWLAL